MTDERDQHLIYMKIEQLLFDLEHHDQSVVAELLLLATIRVAWYANPEIPLTLIANRAISRLSQEHLL